MFNSKNTKKQGDVGLGRAIAFYSSVGYTVSVPLTDSQEYDLIVDDGVELHRVQVKTTSYKPKNSDHFYVSLTIKGGNKSGKKIKKLDKSGVDYIFVLCSDGTMYNIPVSDTGESTLSLSGKYSKYAV